MIHPSPAHADLAQWLLSHERVDDLGVADAGAAVRVFDKLRASLTPLVGALGVQSLFVRSAKLSKLECPEGLSVLDGAAALRECLSSRPVDASAAMFAMFLALITNFIGERLTTQVLRSAWPGLDAREIKETKQ